MSIYMCYDWYMGSTVPLETKSWTMYCLWKLPPKAILEAKNPPGTGMIWIYIPPRMRVATKGLGWDPTKNVMSS